MKLKVSLFFFISFIPFASLTKATICRTYEKMSDEDAPKCVAQTILNRNTENKSGTDTPEVSRRVSRLEEKLENLTAGLSLIHERLENLTATSTINRLVIENLNSAEVRRVIRCNSTGGLLEGNQCFQYVSNAGGETNFAEAERRCQAMNCELPEITSDAMQERVANHVRATWEFGEDSYIHFWLASTYQTANHPSKVVTLESGREVRLSKWRPNYPTSASSFSRMALSVYKDAAHRYNGVFNYPASETRIPLCACNA